MLIYIFHIFCVDASRMAFPLEKSVLSSFVLGFGGIRLLLSLPMIDAALSKVGSILFKRCPLSISLWIISKESIMVFLCVILVPISQ